MIALALKLTSGVCFRHSKQGLRMCPEKPLSLTSLEVSGVLVKKKNKQTIGYEPFRLMADGALYIIFEFLTIYLIKFL